MKKTIIASLFVPLVLSGCSFFGVRSGYEAPSYTLLDSPAPGIEVRKYEPRLAAEAAVETADPDDASNAAFRLLFDYISGANEAAGEIAMTAPVEVEREPQKIAMTVPVETDRDGQGALSMRFFLPSAYTMENAPRPSDERVRLVEMPGETQAVLRFSGSRSDSKVERKKEELLQALRQTSLEPISEPVAYFYDPPWTLPFLRRNEVAVRVATGQG